MPWPGINSEAQFTRLSLLCVMKVATTLKSKYVNVEFIPTIRLLRSVRVPQSSLCISSVVPRKQAVKNDGAPNHVTRAENGDESE